FKAKLLCFIRLCKQINLDNVSPVVDEVASLMNVKTHHEESSTQAPPIPSVHVTVILETSIVAATTVPPLIQPFYSISQMATPTPIPTTEPRTTLITILPNFSSLFGFDQRVSTLEKDMSQFKQDDLSTQLLESVKSQILTIVRDLLSIRIRYATRTALQSYTKEFEKKAQEARELYIDMVEKSMKDIIKNEVKSKLPQILPKEVSDFGTPIIQRTINESLENVVLAKSSSQPQSTYEVATSLTEFELKKILLDKLEKSKSYRAAEQHRDLYDALVKSYQLDKDLFDSYGKVYSLKRGREDKDKDEDPSAGSDQGLKKRKTIKDTEPPKGYKSKEFKSSSSKGSKSQSKSSGKSAQAEEPVLETANTEMPQDQGDDLSKQIDFRPPQTWISKMAKAGKPPTTFDELMSTPIDFSAYVLHNLKIENLTQEHLVGLAFNLLKGTCKS
ncbi:hypothetical protein Tco_1233982, partial [Tanacetum coccineum]